MKPKYLLAAAGFCAASTAWAGVSIDGRLSGSRFELDDGVDKIEMDGVGVDARAHAELGPNLFLRGQVLATRGDKGELNGASLDIDNDLSVFRGGAGIQGTTGSVVLYGAAEYGKVKLKVSGPGGSAVGEDKGFIGSAGLRDDGSGSFLWQAEIGVLALDESEGAALDFTLGYRFTPGFALVVGAQAYALKDDTDVEYRIASGTVGARFSFGEPTRRKTYRRWPSRY